MKKKEIHLKVKTTRFSFAKDCNVTEYNKLRRRVKKTYKADKVYFDNGKIVCHHIKIVGSWKSKRIDGVKV